MIPSFELVQVAHAETMNAVSYVGNVNFENPTWDLFIVIFFVVATLLYGLSLGTSRIAAILFSTYTAYAIVLSVPFFRDVKSAEVGLNQFFVANISVFVGMFVILFLLISRSAITKSLSPSEDRGSWWRILLFSILQVGLLISIILSFLPESSINQLQPMTRDVFASPTGSFGWMVAPIIMLAVFARKKKKRYKYDYEDE